MELHSYCENVLSDKSKYYVYQKRTKTDFDAGVGKTVIVGGTNGFAKLEGTKCNYAVSYLNDRAFVSTKCIIPDKIFEELKR